MRSKSLRSPRWPASPAKAPFWLLLLDQVIFLADASARTMRLRCGMGRDSAFTAGFAIGDNGHERHKSGSVFATLAKKPPEPILAAWNPTAR